MTTTTNTKRNIERSIEVGDFISIPAWNAEGQVIAIEAAWHGSDHAQRVQVQESPDSPNARWYHLEPSEYVNES